VQRSNLIITALLAFIVIYLVVIQNIQPIPTPTPNPNVLIFPDKPAYREGETLTLTLYNNGVDTLTTGYGYGITRRLFIFWVYSLGAPVQQVFTMVAYDIPPRGVFTETISLSGFPSGVYRIEKDGSYTQFTVEGFDYLPYQTLSTLLFLDFLLYLAWWNSRRYSTNR
jgi:hypothetical protein